ncbi:MAG: HIT family protein [Pseudomonadales bacterium]|nr:HIT family protein [Pseudomonadales bacterium]MDP6470339.1 HIT family protein [Pseudomonadales bacterium]MDP6827246.1 HIT family protein [Pseudomonadales bacterium]MDP6972452.1 HIT family protein [Pseudomonadales bacterium]
MSFHLHPQLAADCHLITRLDACDLLLMNDSRYPWCILVPRIEHLRDLHDIPRGRREAVMDEVDAVARALQQIHHADKINVAALGNQVPQLHVHVIARHTTDEAWPGPVWGVGTPRAYEQEPAGRELRAIERALAEQRKDSAL